MNKDIKIAVAMGGPGSEHDVSMATGQAVLKALIEEGCNAEALEINNHEIVAPEGVGLIFNAIHGTFGEDGEMQTQLEKQGVAYTGAGSASSLLAFDKVASKHRFIKADVPTPASETIDCSNGMQMPKMSLPYVVKPSREGSSVGVHIVREEAEARAAIEDAAKYGSEVLVEQFVKGKELTVGVVNDEVFPVVHIVPRSGFYDMSNKYPWMTGEGGTDYYCPADLDAETTRKVQAAALAAHRALGVEVYSRVDVLLDADGNPHVLEANTIPGMTESSLLPKAAKEAGYSFGKLCLKIAEISLETSRNV